MSCEILNLINEGYTHFIPGGAIGVDLDFTDMILGYKYTYGLKITLEIAIPCKNQDQYYENEDKNRYKNIIENANTLTYVSTNYTNFCMQKRNEYMVNKSDIVLAYWNENGKGGTYNILKFAIKRQKKVKILKI